MFSPYINDQAARENTAGTLRCLLADRHMLYVKAEAFPWNVTGPQFEPLHTLFREQYTELASAIDEIAERIRALGVKAPGSFREFASLTLIDEETGVTAVAAMVGQLQSDNAKAARSALQTARLAEMVGDVATVDLATQRVMRHENAAWMLGSLLQR